MRLGKTLDKRDIISAEAALTLDGLFRERVRRSATVLAYRSFDEGRQAWRDDTWSQMAAEVARWQRGLLNDGFKAGDALAIMLKNSPTWVVADQAALSLGLIVVPLYTSDRPDNATYILENADVNILLIEDCATWDAFSGLKGGLKQLRRILYLYGSHPENADARLIRIDQWRPAEECTLQNHDHDPHQLATIIYTSGTTGRPKGVMLSHHNIISNASASLDSCKLFYGGISLSFLPLSHTLERTVGYYMTMMAGTAVAFSRSVAQLAEDLLVIKPTLLISVPRIYERIYAAIHARLADSSPFRRHLFNFAVKVGYARFEYTQGRRNWHWSYALWPLLNVLVAKKLRQKFGGRLKFSLSGGASLDPEVSRVFIGLGVLLLQGYGLTETSPVIATNRIDDNVPESVGTPLANLQVKLGADNALLVRGPSIMLGYWRNQEATRDVLDEEGWFNTGDIVRIDSQGHIYITGRLKEIIVTSTGEKISPHDMEVAIMRDKFFEQVMIVGEGRPYLSLLAIVNEAHRRTLPEACDSSVNGCLLPRDTEKMLLARISEQTTAFPGYAQIRRLAIVSEPWTVENGYLTPTLKLRRTAVANHYSELINKLYEGHNRV